MWCHWILKSVRILPIESKVSYEQWWIAGRLAA
jgi:hypothetical protein